MIIGNGQLAKVFGDSDLSEEVCIFASGVSNSNCTDIHEFEREKKLLLGTLKNNIDKKFVYFSSCALSAKEYKKNMYYSHKDHMENIIKETTNNYYIFRIPQLFGKLKSHKTLINFIYESILESKEFKVYKNAYRYVIEINDVKNLVEAYLKHSSPCITVNLANPYRYDVLSIVKILEELLNKKAIYQCIDKSDGYLLEVSNLSNFIKEKNLNIDFSKDYLLQKLNKQLKNKR